MKTTYYGTMIHHDDLQEAQVFLEVYNHTKYTAHEIGEEPIEFRFKGLVKWEIIEGGDEAEEIERDTDADGIDENHEYLVLHFRNGYTSTYRNSHVVLFIL